jgi:hypothetical protein
MRRGTRVTQARGTCEGRTRARGKDTRGTTKRKQGGQHIDCCKEWKVKPTKKREYNFTSAILPLHCLEYEGGTGQKEERSKLGGGGGN